ncbi:hypothetical protein GGI23_005047 [Coemansia sp. RSA 2559]|nr:hypothetical protein GGI23_005047 [Coemansia sp. RSA 2559]
MAWPTVRLVVSRRTSDTKQAQPSKLSTSSSSSLVIPAVAAPLPSKGGAPSPIAPWSVPPRISMNSVDARVRYLRRDSAVHAFYARCQSVAPRDIARLVCGPPRAGELFMERLPDPVPQQPDPSAAAASPAQADSNGGNADDDAGDFSRIAIEKYSVHGTGHHHRVATPNQFASVMAGVFARIRHELELADPRSARSRWEHLRSQRRDSGMRSGDGDARSVASLVTATADEGWRNVRGQPGGAHAATYQRIVDGLHSEIPVTVAVDVLQGVSAADAARLLEQPWERAEWDTSLFDGRTRRELEYVPGVAGSGGVGVCHSRMHVPLLCDRRDALTVHVTERAAFLPTRRRVRNWEEAHSARSPIAPRSQAGCGNSAATLGDYHDATFTLVEASVPGSQPLSTTVRATVALYAVRVDPIDAFERVVGGRPLALQACRITVACCVDLAGAMPLPLRRAASARVPGQHISQIRARLLQRLSLWPLLAAPSRSRHVAPRLAGSASEGAVAAQVSEQVVDGQRMAFHAALDGSRVVHEAVVSKGSKRAASYVAVVALPQASAAAKARADAHGRPLCSLRKDGDSSDSDANCNDESPLRLFPVVSDVVIGSAATSCFAHGFDINVTTSLSGNLQPIAEASGFAGGGGGGEPSSLWNGSRRREAASRVAGQAAAIPAARWAGDVGECCRLAVYVFALARDGGGRSAELLVRTVLLPPDDEDGGSVELQCAPAESPGATAGSRRPKAAASCTVVIRAACEESRTRAPATAASTPGSMAIPSFAAALDPLGSSRASNQDEGDMPAVWCNGQRLRIHEAMPPKQSLLFVATTDGKRLYACRQCGGLGCDAHEDSGAKGSDGPDTGMAAVGYASDTEDIFVQDGGGLAAVVGQQNADGSGVLAGGEQQQQQQQQPQTQQQQQQQMAVGGRRQCSVPTILLSGGDGQAPRVASLSSSSAAALSVGQGLGTTLRRRIVGGGSSRSSSASAAIFAATTDSNGSKPPTSPG